MPDADRQEVCRVNPPDGRLAPRSVAIRARYRGPLLETLAAPLAIGGLQVWAWRRATGWGLAAGLCYPDFLFAVFGVCLLEDLVAAGQVRHDGGG